MAGPRRVVELSIDADDLTQLEAIARSRSEAAVRVERARMLLAYRANPSSVAVGEQIGVMRHTVRRCVRRAESLGVMAALDDSPRPGKAPQITPQARAWLVSLACQKAKDLGYPHEMWTTRLLARHVREHAASAGHHRIKLNHRGDLLSLCNEAIAVHVENVAASDAIDAAGVMPRLSPEGAAGLLREACGGPWNPNLA